MSITQWYFGKTFSDSGRAYRTLGGPPPRPLMLNDLLKLLRYRDIRLRKMKFLLPVTEKFCDKFKYLNNRMEFL